MAVFKCQLDPFLDETGFVTFGCQTGGLHLLKKLLDLLKPFGGEEDDNINKKRKRASMANHTGCIVIICSQLVFLSGILSYFSQLFLCPIVPRPP